MKYLPNRTGLLTCASRNHTQDRKSTRLNSSHSQISYAVFCLKKKKPAPAVHAHGRAEPTDTSPFQLDAHIKQPLLYSRRPILLCTLTTLLRAPTASSSGSDGC